MVKSSTAFFTLLLMLQGSAGRPVAIHLPPTPITVTRPTDETFTDLLKTLPKTEEALDKYDGDLAKLLSKILGKSGKWKETGTRKYDGEIVAYDEEHQPCRFVPTKDTLKFHINSIVTLSARSGSDVLTSEDSAIYSVKIKDLDAVILRTYYGEYSKYFTAKTKDEVYSIEFKTGTDTYAVRFTKDEKTLDHSGVGTFDDRDRGAWKGIADRVEVEIKCNREEAMAIGRAFKKLIEIKGGKVTFENRTQK